MCSRPWSPEDEPYRVCYPVTFFLQQQHRPRLRFLSETRGRITEEFGPDIHFNSCQIHFLYSANHTFASKGFTVCMTPFILPNRISGKKWKKLQEEWGGILRLWWTEMKYMCTKQTKEQNEIKGWQTMIGRASTGKNMESWKEAELTSFSWRKKDEEIIHTNEREGQARVWLLEDEDPKRL